MISLIVLQLLASSAGGSSDASASPRGEAPGTADGRLKYDPNEKYSELPAEKLLEKKRDLLEERGTFAGPVLATVGGLTLFAGGLGMIGGALATNNRDCSSWNGSERLCYAGGGVALLGGALLTFGLVWLMGRIDRWVAINARLGELDSLFALKTSRQVAVPQPPPVP
ncbi:MAG: hypothetical protein JNK82_31505 [Myxococcaceae bacterium]|nr:hypothetical protein [Myxococcaceae bacterium]